MNTDWIFSQRPSSIAEIATYPNLRERLTMYVDDGNFGHLIFAGGWGTGKTSVARILGATNENSFVEVDCTDNNTPSKLKEVKKGSITQSLFGGRKIIFLDEFHEVAKPTQTIFNKPMEDRNNLAGYILGVNDIDKINPSIISRCMILSFDVGSVNGKTKKFTPHSYTKMTRTEWIDELKRAVNIVADKEGVKIKNKTFNSVLETDVYLTDPRSFVRAVNEQFRMDEK